MQPKLKMRKQLILILIGTFLLSGSVFAELVTTPLTSQKLLTLSDCIKSALQDDAHIKRAQARLEREEALLRAVKLSAFPKFKTELYTAGVSQDPHGIIFWTSELGLPLFEGGKWIHEKKMKSLSVEEEKLHLEEIRREVAYQIKLIYIALVREKELTRLTEEWAEESLRLHLAMKALYQKELITREEFYASETLFKMSQHEFMKHKEALDYADAVIREISDMKETESLELKTLTEVSMKELKPETLLNQMRKQNTLYEIARLRVKEKEEAKKVLRSDRFPKISLTNRYHVSRDSFLDQNRFELGALASWNIWDFGELGAKLKAKDLEIKEAVFENEIQINALENEFRKLVSELKVANGKIEFAKSIMKEKKEHYQNQKTRFITDEVSENEVFDSFVTMTQSEINVSQALTDYWILWATLEHILGKEVLSESPEL